MRRLGFCVVIPLFFVAFQTSCGSGGFPIEGVVQATHVGDEVTLRYGIARSASDSGSVVLVISDVPVPCSISSHPYSDGCGEGPEDGVYVTVTFETQSDGAPHVYFSSIEDGGCGCTQGPGFEADGSLESATDEAVGVTIQGSAVAGPSDVESSISGTFRVHWCSE